METNTETEVIPLSTESGRFVSISTLPSLQVRQAKVIGTAFFDFSPYVTEPLYTSGITWFIFADSIFDRFYSTYRFKENTLSISLAEAEAGYDRNYRIRFRIGKMNASQFKWFLANMVYLSEIPNDKWMLLWHGWGDGKVLVRTVPGINFTLNRGDVIILEVKPLAPAVNFVRFYFITDLIGVPRVT